MLIGAGVLCGFINTLAGCGAAIALTALNFVVPVDAANGTLRIPILFQNVSAVKEFSKHKVYDKASALPIIIPIGLGGIAGALAAIILPHEQLKFAVGIVMFLFFIIQLKKLFCKPSGERENSIQNNKYKSLSSIIFFAVGMYGGFIQIGVGVFTLIAIEHFAKMDLFRANAIKVLGVLCYTVPVFLIFFFDGLIYFKFGLIMAVGNIIGAKLAVKYASKVDVKYIRIILIAVLFFAGLNYTGIFSFLQK